jgi:hypothetical protein
MPVAPAAAVAKPVAVPAAPIKAPAPAKSIPASAPVSAIGDSAEAGPGKGTIILAAIAAVVSLLTAAVSALAYLDKL